MCILEISFSIRDRSILRLSLFFVTRYFVRSPFSLVYSHLLSSYSLSVLYVSVFGLTDWRRLKWFKVNLPPICFIFQVIFLKNHSPMIESMDIAFLLGNIASTDPLFATVRYMISSVINPLIDNNYDVRLASIKSRYDDDSFTSSLAKFEHWFDNDHAPVARYTQGESLPICKSATISSRSYFATSMFRWCLTKSSQSWLACNCE